MVDFKLLLQIVLSFMKIDLLSFGGGYVSIPLVQKEVVEIQKWMSQTEFLNVLAIDELTPGPIAINCATFIGNKLAGPIGGIAATFGSVLPSVILSLIFIKIYFKLSGNNFFDGILGGLKAMVLGLLTSTALSLLINVVIWENNVDIIAIVLFGLSLVAFRKLKKDPIIIVLLTGVIGFVLYSIF